MKRTNIFLFNWINNWTLVCSRDANVPCLMLYPVTQLSAKHPFKQETSGTSTRSSWARGVILTASDVIKRLEWIRRSWLPPFFYFHRVCVDMIISSKLDQLSPLLSWKTRLEKFYVNFPLGILAILSWLNWKQLEELFR